MRNSAQKSFLKIFFKFVQYIYDSKKCKNTQMTFNLVSFE